MIEELDFGMLLRSLKSTLLMIIKVQLTHLGSILMVLASQVEALIDQSRFGILDHQDFCSIMMLILNQ